MSLASAEPSYWKCFLGLGDGGRLSRHGAAFTLPPTAMSGRRKWRISIIEGARWFWFGLVFNFLIGCC